MTEAVEPDEVLMSRYAHGDAAAFECLYRRHEMRTWRYIERNVGNRATADELMQEVWFAVAREAPRYHASRAIGSSIGLGLNVHKRVLSRSATRQAP
jgi:DNA-directed RNA polymerase specialized sigma24 family protein